MYLDNEHYCPETQVGYEKEGHSDDVESSLLTCM
jgi:hypothetical protein